MKKILMLLLTIGSMLFVATGCREGIIKEKVANKNSDTKTAIGDEGMQIQIQGENKESIIFQLNNSTAAKSLYEQLPITIEVENYSNNEKIFYPSKELDVTNTPMAKGPAGTLAYYEPWGDVVMYYDNCEGASNLYALGEAITNVDQIKQLSGTIEISKHQKNTEQKSKAEENIDSTNQESIPPSSVQTNTTSKEEDTMFHVQISINDQTFSASLYDNTSVRALMQRLPLTIDMKDLQGNEKYFYFATSLPTQSQNVSQVYTGDLKLFGSDCLVLFYKDFQTTYSYTSLGQIDNVQGLVEALGKGSKQVHIEKLES